MGPIALDIRYALRSLRRTPGYALATIAVLALGIGANTAMFSLVNGVLLRPLPYTASERLGMIWHEFGKGAQNLPALHPLDYRDYRERSRTFEDFALATSREGILGSEQQPTLVQVGFVASHFFRFLGVDPILGRHLAPEDEALGAGPVILLGHEAWRARFGADPGIVGRTLELDGVSRTIVGVLPEDFRLLLPPEAFRLKHAEMWAPLQIDWARLPPRNYTGFTAFARIRPGVSFDEAQAELSAMAAQLRREHPVHEASTLEARVVPLQFDIVKQARPGLAILMGAVGCVLLVACANVANLALARGRARQRELSLRIALGASRLGLMRLVLTESLLLALSGALLGVALALGGLQLVRAFAGSSLPRLESVRIDAGVLAFTAALGVAAALLFGLLPALAAARTQIAGALVEGAYSSESMRQGRLRSVLIAAEVALSLVLLVGAGLLLRSFAALQHVSPGFEPQGVLTLRLTLPAATYAQPEQRIAFYDAVRARLLALPGVTQVAATSQLPLTGRGSLQPYAYDAETARNWESVTADDRTVTPGYFEAIGARLVAGRDFVRSELGGAQRPIVIDETLARRVWGSQDPIGQRLQLDLLDAPRPYGEVVGVVSHVHLHDLTRALLPEIFEPAVPERISLAIRTSGDPAAQAAAVRAAIHAVEPLAALADVQPLAALVQAATASARLSLALMGCFGVLALVLASVGLYAVVSYSIGRRTRELGVRLALGATPRGIQGLVLGESARLIGASLGMGLAGAAALAVVLRGVLVSVAPWDPLTYASATTCLGLVALFACWIPARRAARMSPMLALRRD